MEYRSILVVGAGLAWSAKPGDSAVIVDKEAAAVCKRAAELLRELDADGTRSRPPTIFITATSSPEFRVSMSLVYLECLCANGVPYPRINIGSRARTFNTRGEAEAFPTLRNLASGHAHTHAVHVVDRDFHMRRTLMLLRAQLRPWEAEKTTFHPHPVKSGERMQNLIKESLAYVKDSFYAQQRQRELALAGD